MARYELVEDAAPRYELVETQDGGSGPLPANAGLANFVSSALGLPMDTVQNAVNLTRAAQGTVAGALGKTDWMPPLMSNIPGGSENIRNMMRRTDIPGLNPDNPAPDSASGSIQYDMMSRGGFIPGAALPAASSIVAEKTLGPEWAGVGAMAPAAAMTAYNAARGPSLRRAEQQNSMRDSVLREGREAGYVVAPSKAGGGVGNATLENVAGKAAVGQDAAIRNQQITNALARKEIGLPQNSPISVQALEARRSQLAAPYREVSSLNTQASELLPKLQETRVKANQWFRSYDTSHNPSHLSRAQRLTNEAKGLELQLENIAKAAGKPELVQQLRNARMNIAKTFDVERALNVATGDVSAPVLGRMVDQGKPITGGLATAGKMQQAFPQFMREGASVPPPTSGALTPYAAAALGMGGYSLGGPFGAAAAAAPMLRPLARRSVLSDTYQNMMMPNYEPLTTMRPAPLLLQLGILNQEEQ